jgi:hypothetical protein
MRIEQTNATAKCMWRYSTFRDWAIGPAYLGNDLPCYTLEPDTAAEPREYSIMIIALDNREEFFALTRSGSSYWPWLS